MKKTVLIFCLLNLISGLLYAQVYKGQLQFSKVPFPSQHYQEEYTFDTVVNAAAWNTQTAGLHASFATTDELFFRTEVPVLEKETLIWNATGWKGERLNTQVLVWSTDSLNQIRFSVSNLKKANGKTITRNLISTQLVRYVVSNYPYGAKDATCGVSEYKNLYL
ncbi:MAG TPA: hypothetical protein VNR87_08820, partial [Flavisolibacter sp.]|nr:hypothetical protein [Flavisolibacter sp.]